jgi:hypothetical protein
MKCLYYLSSTIGSTHTIASDIQATGVNHWFLHILSKDTAGVKKNQLHSGNFIEQLDVMRDGILGAMIGLITGLVVVAFISYKQYFPPEIPDVTYFFVIMIITMFGAWEGGLLGITNESKKLAAFQNDLNAGKYLILVYARGNQEDVIISMMKKKHPNIRLVGNDSSFFNPLSRVQRI